MYTKEKTYAQEGHEDFWDIYSPAVDGLFTEDLVCTVCSESQADALLSHLNRE
jgi:hypothetical protein